MFDNIDFEIGLIVESIGEFGNPIEQLNTYYERGCISMKMFNSGEGFEMTKTQIKHQANLDVLMVVNFIRYKKMYEA